MVKLHRHSAVRPRERAIYAGPAFVDALKSAPPRKEYLDARKPLVKLVEDLVSKRGAGHIYIRRENFTLSAGRRS